MSRAVLNRRLVALEHRFPRDGGNIPVWYSDQPKPEGWDSIPDTNAHGLPAKIEILYVASDGNGRPAKVSP